MASLSLPQAGAWLNCPPLPALGLHLRGPEFVIAAKFRLGMQVYDSAGNCPACGRHSDVLGDHGMVCGTGVSALHSTMHCEMLCTTLLLLQGWLPKKKVKHCCQATTAAQPTSSSLTGPGAEMLPLMSP